MSFQWPIFEWHCIGIVMAFDRLFIFMNIDVQDLLPVQLYAHDRPFAGYFIAVPLHRLEELLFWRDRPVETPCQLAGWHFHVWRIIPRVHHLQFQPVERRVTGVRKAQAAAAVTSLA